MQQQGTHQQHAPSPHEALGLAMLLPETLGLIVSQSTSAMRTPHYTERAHVRTTVIEVQPNRHERFEH